MILNMNDFQLGQAKQYLALFPNRAKYRTESRPDFVSNYISKRKLPFSEQSVLRGLAIIQESYPHLIGPYRSVGTLRKHINVA